MKIKVQGSLSIGAEYLGTWEQEIDIDDPPSDPAWQKEHADHQKFCLRVCLRSIEYAMLHRMGVDD